MRALFLVTGTNEVLKYTETLRALGWEIALLQYDDPGLSDETLYAQVRDEKPDLLVYIGARWGKMPGIATLSTMSSRIAPMVHICSDAGDTPWHDLLREYHSAGSFTLQVAIDGSHKWPLAGVAMTALTPVDPALFGEPMSHAKRTIICGYAGNPGSGNGSRRTGMLSALLQRQVIDQLHIRSNLPHTNGMYNRFLGMCRMSVNIAWTGTEQQTHVKGRVLESALAGACLLETKGAPTSYWFRPGLDYLEYESPDHAAEIIRGLRDHPEATEAMAFSLRRRVMEEHSPKLFWERIFLRIGLDANRS